MARRALILAVALVLLAGAVALLREPGRDVVPRSPGRDASRIAASDDARRADGEPPWPQRGARRREHLSACERRRGREHRNRAIGRRADRGRIASHRSSAGPRPRGPAGPGTTTLGLDLRGR